MHVERMVEARAPDALRDWTAMDIFIFANGQKYSPPRKYHLCSDDLKFWESTISFLAHSQYGSLHSKIELYTIEGRKVVSPLELSNEAAYVAVKPPDAFIQSGYDKYLLKASRSWEKRQEKRLSGVVNSLQEKIHVSGNIEITAAAKSPKQNSISASETGKCCKPSSTTKYKSATATKPASRSPNLSSDPIDKRKLLSTKAILRKSNNTGKLSDSSTMRDCSLIKNLGAINKSVIKQGLTPSETPIIDAILDTDSSASTNKVPNDKENIVTVDKPNNQILEIIIEKGETNNENIKVSPNKPTFSENNNVYKNPLSETMSLIVEVDKEITKNEFVQKIDPNLCNLNVGKLDTRPKGDDKQTDLTISLHDTATQATQESCISTNGTLQQAQTKECIFNLHLNIEVKDNGAHPADNNVALSKCFSIKSGNESILDIQGHLKGIVNEKVDSSKAFHDGKNCRTSQNCDDSKFIVVRCSCSSQHLEKNKIFALQCAEKDKDYFVLVPTQGFIKADGYCQWTKAKAEDTQHKTSTDDKVDDDHFQFTRIKPTDSDNTKQAEIENSKTENAKEHKVSIALGSPELMQSSTIEPVEEGPQNGHEMKIPDEFNTNLVNERRSDSTQTQWCDVLLEARRSPAGDYMFYLPTIKDIKDYKL